MKIDKRIQQAIDYNVKEILIKKDTYKKRRFAAFFGYKGKCRERIFKRIA